MANDYSEVVLPELLINFEEEFKGLRHELIMFENPVTAGALMQKQTAILNPQFDANGRCTGYSVAYQQADQNTIGSGSGTATAACVIVPDQTFSGLKETYDINRFFVRKASILGKDCDSKIKFAQRLTKALAVEMQQISLELNQWAIATLLANKQTATHQGEYGTGITAGVIDYPKADLLDPTLFQSRMSDWHYIGIEELLPANMFAIHGRNFILAQREAQFNAANDDQRSQALAFAAFPSYWDILGFGASRANIIDNSFLIDPNAYVFITRNHYDMAPVFINTATVSETQFSLPLTYMDANGQTQTMMYNYNGTMAPVMVDCRVQYACNSTASVDGLPTFDYNIEMRLAADFKLAPNQSGSTGIVQILAS